jgi:hypothetical protein
MARRRDNVIVIWWETNQTCSDTPVASLFTDAGQTFGHVLRLGINGTRSSTDDRTTTVCWRRKRSGVAADTERPTTEAQRSFSSYAFFYSC